MFIGYARVSTADQTMVLQEDALQKAGCEKIFKDVMSGSTTDRPGLSEALMYARPGDVLVVWRLDRLGRSLAHLIQVVQELQDKNIGFRSLQENMDTTTSGGQLIFHIFGALAEFERALIRERTMAGLAAARQRGRVGGRPRALSPDQLAMARHLLERPDLTGRQVADALHISRATLYRSLRRLSDDNVKLD
ncbi:recombinase family protein [Sulfobacillus harzensis]|uniref:Recombinase family protein n=1 Tax=Sulfobacillus harzensis TaxID=2729629 RepID=A0A7Y0L8E9_9FIRM|nr:recombinase family protein [Sulfobacillus harzensis]